MPDQLPQLKEQDLRNMTPAIVNAREAGQLNELLGVPMPPPPFTPTDEEGKPRAITEDEFLFGAQTSVFKVGGKMFALTALDTRPLTVSLKCEPSLAEALRAEHRPSGPATTCRRHPTRRRVDPRDRPDRSGHRIGGRGTRLAAQARVTGRALTSRRPCTCGARPRCAHPRRGCRLSGARLPDNNRLRVGRGVGCRREPG